MTSASASPSKPARKGLLGVMLVASKGACVCVCVCVKVGARLVRHFFLQHSYCCNCVFVNVFECALCCSTLWRHAQCWHKNLVAITCSTLCVSNANVVSKGFKKNLQQIDCVTCRVVVTLLRKGCDCVAQQHCPSPAHLTFSPSLCLSCLWPKKVSQCRTCVLFDTLSRSDDKLSQPIER